ncbi:MAG: TetR/AcrR family transcriptional regulator [Spongiibacteraceae bacterium]
MTRPPSDKNGHHNVLQFEVPARQRKHPRQARSIALVDALKETGREILESEGREALSAQHLSDRAGVAISSIYEYFPTMESLVAAIFNEYRTEIHRELIEQLQALPPTAKLFDGIVLMLRTFMAVRYKWSQIDPEFTARYIQYDELLRLEVVKPDHVAPAAATLTLMERFADEVVVRDREKVVFLIYHTVQALPRVIALERPALLNDENTLLLLAKMLEALLTTG